MQLPRVALLLAWILAGCDDPQPPPIPVDAGRPRDAAARDAAPLLDARASGDSGAAPDAGAPTCTVRPDDVHKVGTDTAGDRVVALAAGSSGFGALYTAQPDDGPVARVHAVALSSSGVLGEPRQLTTAGAARRPVSLAALQSGWIGAWVDNDPAQFEVRTLALGADLAPAAATAVHVTATEAAEDVPTLLPRPDGALLAWIEDDVGTRIARAQPVGADGAPMGAASDASMAAHRPGSLALAELSEGPALLYASAVEGSSGPETHVFLQPLTAAGAMRGTAAPIDREGLADGTLDAALTPDGGAVVFGVLVAGARHEVRFRALGGDGTPQADERVLAEGTDASIAAFAGGYAVSFRAPASGEAPAEVRLLLVSELGDVAADVLVAEAMPQGGRTTVRVSGDGRIAVGWADTAGDETDILLAYVACGAGT